MSPHPAPPGPVPAVLASACDTCAATNVASWALPAGPVAVAGLVTGAILGGVALLAGGARRRQLVAGAVVAVVVVPLLAFWLGGTVAVVAALLVGVSLRVARPGGVSRTDTDPAPADGPPPHP